MKALPPPPWCTYSCEVAPRFVVNFKKIALKGVVVTSRHESSFSVSTEYVCIDNALRELHSGI
jgi:hypothetical protein